MTRPPIFGFNSAARRASSTRWCARVCDAVRDRPLLLSEAAFLEVKRQQVVGQRRRRPPRRVAFARRRSLGRMSDEECRDTPRATSSAGYARDVAGNFDPRVYQFAVPRRWRRSSACSCRRCRRCGTSAARSTCSALDGRVVIEGPVGHASARSPRRGRSSSSRPTCPTSTRSSSASRSSGRGCRRRRTARARTSSRTPCSPTSCTTSGAYRVDRRLKHGLYKDVLKTYSCVLIERGYHSLFFPGGTRSRSGGVERKLKLGLAGTGRRGHGAHGGGRASTRPVFFVPATINYLLTLEAETLVDDFLSGGGQAPVHHRGRRVDAAGAHRGLHPQAARPRRGLRHPLRQAARLLRQRGRRGRRVARRARPRGRPALVT